MEYTMSVDLDSLRHRNLSHHDVWRAGIPISLGGNRERIVSIRLISGRFPNKGLMV